MNDDPSPIEQAMLALVNKRQAHPLPAVKTEAPAGIPQLPLLDRLAKMIRGFGNPTAGAEVPTTEQGSDMSMDRDQPGNEIKQAFRNTNDPAERARIQRRVGRF